MIKKLKLTESQFKQVIKESVEKVLSEISSQFIQDRLRNTWNKQQDGYYWDVNKGDYVDIDKKDTRFRKLRKIAAQKYTDERHTLDDFTFFYNNDDDKWIKEHSNDEVIYLDTEYKTLEDLYNGVKNGDLLIHCRRMIGKVAPNYIYPEAGETVQGAYGTEYEEADIELPELVFASDDFSWANGEETRNGVFFVRSDNFQRSIGSGYYQMPNGECGLDETIPLTVEPGDWYSEQAAEVVAILIKK